MATGIRFKVGGIVERALKALASTHRRKHHHFDLALIDLENAANKLKVAEVDYADTVRRATLLPGEDAVKVLNTATALLAIARRAVSVAEMKCRARINPATGRPVVPEGRAPGHLHGAADVLAAESEARQRLADAERIVSAGARLLPLAAHDAWRRLQFPYYVDSIAHQDAQRAFGGFDRFREMESMVLAFRLYVAFEARINGVPVVIRIDDRTVTVAHAIWGDRLPLGDVMAIATFIAHAGQRLNLDIAWDETSPTVFQVVGPLSKRVDYDAICRALRENARRNPFEEDVTDLRDDRRVDVQDQDVAEHAVRVDDLVAVDPRPQLSAVEIRAAALKLLPYQYARLFRIPREFDQSCQAALEKRTPGAAWYADSWNRVDPQLVAGELMYAVQTGDVACCLWWHEMLSAAVADDLVAEIVGLTVYMLLVEHDPGALEASL